MNINAENLSSKSIKRIEQILTGAEEQKAIWQQQ